MPPPNKPEVPASIFGRFAAALTRDWRSRARPAQIPPEDFSVWLFLAGRGSGKTWAAANYICEQAASGAARRIALIGATAGDARFTMVEGASGILAVARPGERPEWEPAKGQLTWAGGAIARLYSADSPDALRGPEHDLAWADEVAAWRRADEAWSNLMLGLRGGTKPRVIVTTTPRPVRLVRDLVARSGTDGIVVSRSSTYDNRANLPATFFAQLVKKFEGTRLARQELLAEVLEDVPGALWARDVLEETRVDSAPPLQRVVIGVDPAGSAAEGADLTGIVACGVGQDGHLYVLSDLSFRGTPREWAGKAIGAFHSLKADKVVVERNFGGDMASATLASVDPGVPVKAVTSSRGKVLRAEPIASLFEQRRAHLVGTLPALEDQLCSFTSDWDRRRDGSPDRVDAMTFAASELMLQEKPPGFIREEALLVRAEATGESAPVDMPHECENVFGFAAIAESEPDALAVVYFANARGNPSLVVLDWDVHVIESGTFGAFFRTTTARLSQLVQITGSSSPHAPLLAEPAGMGKLLLEQARLRRYGGVIPIEDAELLDKELSVRMVEVANYLQAGSIKLAAAAHSKSVTFKGAHRNHLIADLAAFTLGDEKPRIGALAAAFATGALHAFGDNAWKSVWLALAGHAGPPGSLGAAPEPAEPTPDEPRPWIPETIHATRDNPVLAQRRAEHAARNEAERQRELADFRAREARLRQEGLL